MKSIEFVVCHDTANNNAGAYGHVSYLQGGGGGTSWHYSCGHDAIYRHLPDNEVAYHAGDGTKYGYKLYDSGVKATVARPHLTIDSEGYYCFNGVRSVLKKPSDSPKNALITPSGLYYEIGENGNITIVCNDPNVPSVECRYSLTVINNTWRNIAYIIE